eukprot:843065_1
MFLESRMTDKLYGRQFYDWRLPPPSGLEQKRYKIGGELEEDPRIASTEADPTQKSITTMGGFPYYGGIKSVRRQRFGTFNALVHAHIALLVDQLAGRVMHSVYGAYPELIRDDGLPMRKAASNVWRRCWSTTGTGLISWIPGLISICTIFNVHGRVMALLDIDRFDFSAG